MYSHVIIINKVCFSFFCFRIPRICTPRQLCMFVWKNEMESCCTLSCLSCITDRQTSKESSRCTLPCRYFFFEMVQKGTKKNLEFMFRPTLLTQRVIIWKEDWRWWFGGNRKMMWAIQTQNHVKLKMHNFQKVVYVCTYSPRTFCSIF